MQRHFYSFRTGEIAFKVNVVTVHMYTYNNKKRCDSLLVEKPVPISLSVHIYLYLVHDKRKEIYLAVSDTSSFVFFLYV